MMSETDTEFGLVDLLVADLRAQGQFGHAARVIRSARHQRIGRLDPDHAATVASTIQLASALIEEGNVDEAEQLLSGVQPAAAEHRIALWSNRGAIEFIRNNHLEALSLRQRALTDSQAAFGDGSAITLSRRLDVAASLITLGRAGEALALLDELPGDLDDRDESVRGVVGTIRLYSAAASLELDRPARALALLQLDVVTLALQTSLADRVFARTLQARAFAALGERGTGAQLLEQLATELGDLDGSEALLAEVNSERIALARYPWIPVVRQLQQLRLGDVAPDFVAPTTEGVIGFHDWLGESWGMLFSHFRDFTPVAVTELGTVARMKPEFDRRNVKVIALGSDGIDTHQRWMHDIVDTEGTPPNFPIIGDEAGVVSTLYGVNDPAHPVDMREVFVIGPDKKLKLRLTYPASTGRNFDEILRALDSLQLTSNYDVATPANWQRGDDVIIGTAVSDDAARTLFPQGWTTLKPYLRITREPRK